MEWILRLNLGLPARPADLDAIRRSVPEILDQEWKSGHEGREFVTVLLAVHHFVVDDPESFAARVRDWVRGIEGAPSDSQPAPPRIDGECPHPECPFKPISEERSAEPLVTHLMRVGGGPDRKPPLEAFLDVVRTVHSGHGKILQVIVTDPYLLTDRSENGTPGGFENFLKYLDALRIETMGSVDLFITPGPKKPSANRERWEAAAKTRFPRLRIKPFSAQLHFHDRFYIAHHEHGVVRGVFGPSLNGLGDTDIALIGEIEFADALSTLSRWFVLGASSPNRRRRR
jgi:hypothetical protein